MFSPCTIQDFVTTRHFIFLSTALLLVSAVAAAEAGNKTSNNGEVVLINLPLKIEDAIVSAAVAGSGDNEAAGEEIRHQNSNNSPARGEESSNGGKLAPDNSGEDIGYMGAGLLGAAIGAGLGAAWGGTGNYGANYYQQGYNPGIYGGYPYAPAVGYPQTYPGYPLPAGYRPPRPDSFYPPPGPAYGDHQDYFYADAKAADGLAGFGGSYPGYYSELLAGAASPVKVTPVGSTTTTTDSIGSSPGPSTSTGGTTSSSAGYPIDWSAVAESYYSDVSSRSYPSAQTEDEPTAIFVSDSYYPFLFDDY